METRELIHNLLLNKYIAFYLSHPDQNKIVEELVEHGYFNDDTGQATEKAQEYVNKLYSEIEEELLRNLRKKNRWVYNELSLVLNLGRDNLFLHHFLHRLQREEVLYYKEPEDFNSEFRIMIR